MSLGLLVAALASCDTEVINPGPIGLASDQSTHRSLDGGAGTNGAGRALSDALELDRVHERCHLAREVHPSGSTGSFGITPEQQRGELNCGIEVGTDSGGGRTSARFLADEANLTHHGLSIAADLRTPMSWRRPYLYAGYTSRLLGEQMCQAVYPMVSPPEANADSHLDERDLTYFDQAAAMGSG